MKKTLLKKTTLIGLFIMAFASYKVNAQSAEQKQAALIEEATKLLENGKTTEGYKKVQEAYDACPTCPDAPQLKQLLEAQGMMAQIDDTKYKCDDMPTDEGMTSSTHSGYVKKIVFSKTEIVKGEENPSTFTNSFSSSDNIYSRVYLAKSRNFEAKSIGICYGVGSTIYYRYTVDGGSIKFSDKYAYNTTSGSCDKECMDVWTTWQIGISPSEADVKSGYPQQELQDFYARLYELPAGNHTIKVELVYDIPEDKMGDSDMNSYMYTTKFGAEKILASGEFTLNVKESDKALVKQKLGGKTQKEVDDESEAAYQNTMTYISNNSTSGSGYVGVSVANKCGSSVYYIVETSGGSSTKKSVSSHSSNRESLNVGDKIKSSSGTLLVTVSSSTKEVIVCQ